MFAGEEEQMRWSLTVGRVGETVVRIHLTLVVLLAWYAWEGWRVAGARGAVDQFLFIALLFVSVLLHEFGHIRAAHRYGIPTPDVILTPIGGIARIARMPDKPVQELVIALAGPLVTLLIAAALGAILLVGSPSGSLAALGSGEISLWTALFWTNVILLVFNLIPAFPMDGGRVFRALLASRIGMVRGADRRGSAADRLASRAVAQTRAAARAGHADRLWRHRNGIRRRPGSNSDRAHRSSSELPGQLRRRRRRAHGAA
jgi:Zn-dependent protease